MFEKQIFEEQVFNKNNIKEELEINLSELLNLDKINKIKKENNKILNIDDLILNLIKSIKSPELILNTIKFNNKILDLDTLLDILKPVKNPISILDKIKNIIIE